LVSESGHQTTKSAGCQIIGFGQIIGGPTVLPNFNLQI
jgi:hypothetical protein